MSQILQTTNALGRREATTVATATTQRVFASLTTSPPTLRQAVTLGNLDATAELYVVLSPAGSSAPTISSVDNDLILPPRTDRQLQIGVGIDVWVRSNGAGSVAYTARELL